MKETKSKYEVGFVLHHAQCLNCDFVAEPTDKFYELKEEICKSVEESHEYLVFFDKTDCTKRELLIRFGNAVREVI